MNRKTARGGGIIIVAVVREKMTDVCVKRVLLLCINLCAGYDTDRTTGVFYIVVHTKYTRYMVAVY